MDLNQYIRDVPDFPKPGILFKDITPLLKSGEGFRHTIDLFADRYRDRGITQIIGIESRGFLFASALAYKLGTGVVPIRKKGKLPASVITETYDLEYGTDCIQIHDDALVRGEKVVVIDDVIATGGTLAAACRLARTVGAEVVEAATVIELTFLPGVEKLGDVPFYSLLKY